MRRPGPVLVLFAVPALAAAWLLRPPAPVRAPALRAASSYDEAIGRLFDLLERDTLALAPGCGSAALLTGARAPRAFVLLHGITNCPLQFAAIAESLRAGGDNVLVPRVDRHGHADRMTGALAGLRAEDLAALVTECAGIARGLGDTVIVCGLSTSGVAAAWAAIRLAGVDRAVVVAPAFAPPWRPGWLARPLTRLALRTPNRFVWWDDARREDLPGPSQCYPRFATRAMGEVYRLGEDAFRGLPRRPAGGGELAVVTTLSDRAVDNGRARALAGRWRAAGARAREFAFPEAAGVVHDMVDPAQVGARTDVAYPVLLAMLRGQRLPAPAGEGAGR